MHVFLPPPFPVQAQCHWAVRRDRERPERGSRLLGLVGRCLARQAAQGRQLAPNCHALVLAAAPHDVRAMFDRGMSLEAVAGKVAQVRAKRAPAAHPPAGLWSSLLRQNDLQPVCP
jgi:hypothetical protein